MIAELPSSYESRYSIALVPIARELENHLSHILQGVPRVDRISCRAKTLHSFINKALKVRDNGEPKYSNPLVQIQDQIGARITVFYLSDVEVVKSRIHDYLTSIEWIEKKPESDMEFSYFGEHYIVKIPEDAIPDGLEDLAPEFFELQIKTLFQHAWSESSHDIAYKAPRPLTSLEQRNLAFSAAQAWGADQIFDQLGRTLTVEVSIETSEKEH